MKCIVTAGPTYEELDEVRRLTNFSTGTLGTALADYLAGRGHEVVLLRGKSSTCQVESKARRTHVFTTSDDLRRRLKKLQSVEPDAVFHAAAVSDFKFGRIWRREANGKLKAVRSAKISTREATVLAELAPAPKIIAQMRSWFPNARLIGWKYEVEGSRTRSVARARQQLADNTTDACVINGRAYGAGFGLVTPGRECRHLRDRDDLFEALERMLR